MSINNVIISFGILFVIILILWLLKHMSENFVPQYLSQKSKSFSAEKAAIAMYGDQGAWLGNPAKTFSAERHGVAVSGDISGGFIGKSMKFY